MPGFFLHRKKWRRSLPPSAQAPFDGRNVPAAILKAKPVGQRPRHDKHSGRAGPHGFSAPFWQAPNHKPGPWVANLFLCLPSQSPEHALASRSSNTVVRAVSILERTCFCRPLTPESGSTPVTVRKRWVSPFFGFLFGGVAPVNRGRLPRPPNGMQSCLGAGPAAGCQ